MKRLDWTRFPEKANLQFVRFSYAFLFRLLSDMLLRLPVVRGNFVQHDALRFIALSGTFTILTTEIILLRYQLLPAMINHNFPIILNSFSSIVSLIII